MLPALILLAGGLPHPAGVGQVVAPVLADFLEHLEILGEIHLLARVVVARGVLVPARGGFLEADIVHGHLLERRVGLQFLLDGGAEVERGDLQDLQRLPHLRRQHELLRLPLVETLLESGAAHACKGFYRWLSSDETRGRSGRGTAGVEPGLAGGKTSAR